MISLSILINSTFIVFTYFISLYNKNRIDSRNNNEEVEVSILEPTVVTAQQMQAYDKYTIETIGMPSAVLMERAALGVIATISAGDFDLSRVLIVAGTGNNGGDGLAVARILHLKGVDVKVLLLGDERKLSKANKEQLAICRKYQVKIGHSIKDFRYYTLIIDALFGIGLTRDITGKLAEAVKKINASNQPVVAVDIPSGLDATTGKILGSAIRANTTVTFGYLKVGLTVGDANKRVGKVIVKDIGIYAPEF
jgi:NAD(P)H-hydrate epimerase